MQTTTAATTQLPTGVWHADHVHSDVGFTVRHMGVNLFRGRFEAFDGTLEVDADGAAALAGTVEADSIVVRHPALAEHLRGEDFFHVDVHPRLRFTSTALRRDGSHLELDGDLEIRGVTRSVTATGTVAGPDEDPWGATRLGIALRTTIDRRQFGLEWNLPLPGGGLALGHEVTLLVGLELVAA
jgi:polyisoprenoid-binding protein YceI